MSELKNLKALLNITGSMPSTDAKRLIERVEELEEELENWKATCEILSDETGANILRGENERLKEQNQRYREALEFYAHKESYGSKSVDFPTVWFDEGEKARQALKGEDV